MHRSENGTAIFRYPAYFLTCGWPIVISPMIPQDSPSCNHSAMRYLVVPFSERRPYTFRGSSGSKAAIAPWIASLIVKKVVRRAELLKGHRQGFRRALD
jgi:hypothetical protein